MNNYILILNAGSSSLKFSVFCQPGHSGWRLECGGQVEGLGAAPRLWAKSGEGDVLIDRRPRGEVRNGRDALNVLAAWLKSSYGGARVAGVGHRVVHGGERFTGPTIITPRVMSELHRLIQLAPLHLPYNLAAIDAVTERLRDAPQVACFDTSFHRTQAPVAQVIPLPRHFRDAGIQRYGFHGLSYEYIASALPEAAPELVSARVLIAHLGSTASICAVRNGKSVDSSFGFSSLDGLCMGTRPGSIDPGAVLYLFQGMGLSAPEVEEILYKQSGLAGLSGAGGDMRDLLNSSEPGARLAVDYFVYRAAKEIGALAAVLGGVDGIVFTAGIGENSPEIRRRICEACSWLGIELNTKSNGRNGRKISTGRSKVSAWVIPTNEDLMIARQTGTLLGLLAAHA